MPFWIAFARALGAAERGSMRKSLYSVVGAALTRLLSSVRFPANQRATVAAVKDEDGSPSPLVGHARRLMVAVVLASVCGTAGAQALFSGAANTNTPPGTATDPGMKWYVSSSSGSDTNAGNSPAAPFATVGKVNAAATTGLFRPGDSILFLRGDTFRDSYLSLVNAVTATATTTLQSNPPQFSNLTFGAYGNTSLPNPLIDGADPLTGLTWTQYSGNVYVASLATLPLKLYVDAPPASVCANTTNGGLNSVDCYPLDMQPNFLSTDCTLTQTCQLGDAYLWSATNHWEMYVWPSTTLPSVGQSYAQTSQFYALKILGTQGTWAQWWPNTTNTGPQNVAIHGSGSVFLSPFFPGGYGASTSFTSTGGGPNCVVAGSLIATGGVPQYPVYTSNTGCTSVPTIIVNSSIGGSFYGSVDHGSWYYNTATQQLFVQLQDGTNPSGHVLSATHRPYGVLAQSVNHVTIQNIDVAHVMYTGINFRQYSNATLAGAYTTSEYNTVVGAHVWNWGYDTPDSYAAQTYSGSGSVQLAAGIAFKYSDPAPHLQRGNRASRNYVGTADGKTASGGTAGAGIYFRMQDGGGAANNYEVDGNIVRTGTQVGIDYGGDSATATANGGRVAYNTLINNNQSMGFSGIRGGRLDHNYVPYGGGQGAQLGGNSLGSGNADGVYPPALLSEVSGSTPAPPQIIDHNLLNRTFVSTGAGGYNAFDCNSGAFYFSGPWYINNTTNNNFDASVTIEGLNNGGPVNGHATNTYGGCTQYHMLGNIFQQGGYPAPAIVPVQGSSAYNVTGTMYWAYAGNIQTPRDGQNNVWFNVSTGSVFRNTASCANWLTGNFTENGSTDGNAETNSICSDALFTNPATASGLTDDLSLTSSSPAIGRNASQVGVQGVGTKDSGAVPYGQTVLQSVGAAATSYVP